MIEQTSRERASSGEPDARARTRDGRTTGTYTTTRTPRVRCTVPTRPILERAPKVATCWWKRERERDTVGRLFPHPVALVNELSPDVRAIGRSFGYYRVIPSSLARYSTGYSCRPEHEVKEYRFYVNPRVFSSLQNRGLEQRTPFHRIRYQRPSRGTATI